LNVLADMNMLKVSVAFGCFALLTQSAMAEECVGSTADKLQCLGETYGKAQAALDAAYVKRIDQLSGPSKTTYIENELAWTRNRYSTCRDKAAAQGSGASRPLAYQNCMLEMTRQHLREIQGQSNGGGR